jgi:4-hydroxyphenylpyruvate dioxygenase-like putative hemolysin
MARPTITLSASQVGEVETLAALLNQDQIADYFGISRTTFQAILGRDEEVAVRYKRGKAKAIAHVANGLLQKARSGDTTSAIFYLKTQGGWRETAQIEHNGTSTLHISKTIVSPAGKLRAHLDQAAARLRAPEEEVR